MFIKSVKHQNRYIFAFFEVEIIYSMRICDWEFFIECCFVKLSNSGNSKSIRTKLKIKISHNAVSVYTGFKMEGDGDNDKIPEIKYHRRLDRSPEKVLKLMNEYDKKLISEFRRAKENARHKLVDLQDEIDDRCVFTLGVSDMYQHINVTIVIKPPSYRIHCQSFTLCTLNHQVCFMHSSQLLTV